MSYAICFDFPELDDPVFAYRGREGVGLTRDLSEAARFSDEDDAARLLSNEFGTAARKYAVVVECAR